MTDPATGKPMTDANIYGRYYTNAMQRIDLPAGVASFQLQYNGNEIQQLSISAGSQPFKPSKDAFPERST